MLCVCVLFVCVLCNVFFWYTRFKCAPKHTIQGGWEVRREGGKADRMPPRRSDMQPKDMTLGMDAGDTDGITAGGLVSAVSFRLSSWWRSLMGIFLFPI